jgi:hypothetical protein
MFGFSVHAAETFSRNVSALKLPVRISSNMHSCEKCNEILLRTTKFHIITMLYPSMNLQVSDKLIRVCISKCLTP